MSVLEEHASMTLNDYPRSSSIAQRFYLDSTQLSSNPTLNNADSTNAENSKQPGTEDPSGLVATSTELPSYDPEVEKKLMSHGDVVPYFGQPIYNVPVPSMINTLNSNYPNVVTPTTQAFSTTNAINYYDLFAARSQTQTMTTPVQPIPYYPGQDYSKYPLVPPPSSTSLGCIQTYPVGQHPDYSDRGQTAFQTSSTNRLMESSYFPTYAAPGTEGTRFNSCTTSGGTMDGHSRCSDSLNGRPTRHPYPAYHLPTTDDPLTQTCVSPRPGTNGVELLVSNLDYNIGAKEWRKLLFTQLQSTIKNVHSIVIQTQADGSNCAIIKVGSIEDARLAISHFHRKKIGYKRIQVNIVSPNGTFGTKGLKNEVVSLLRSVSSNALPVCKFIDLFEKRFHRSISVSDLYKMRDVIEIKEQPGSQGGRLVALSVRAQRFEGIETNPTADPVLCRRHCVEGSQEYLQAMDCAMLPNVQVSLNVFRQHVLKLLQDHGGSMPLLSFPACYKAEFGELTVIPSSPNQTPTGGNADTSGTLKQSSNPTTTESVQPTAADSSQSASATSTVAGTSSGASTGSNPTMETETNHERTSEVTNSVPSAGVPLEHLLTSVPSVRILVEQNGVRKLLFDPGFDQMQSAHPINGLSGPCHLPPNGDLFCNNKSHLPDPLNPISPSISQPGVHVSGVCPNGTSTPGVLLDQLHQFSREVVDLLKHQPGCQILLSKFIPSYHHHFGKQCRVADYGYSKLHELIDALPSVVHVMGSGHVRLLTLSHRVQVRRFTNELIKVLKSQSTKSCRLTDYAAIYRRIYRKDFRITDYGVCYLSDMLMEVSDSAVEISQVNGDTVISLPKRVQTMEERERTELFAIEVADLLCQSPRRQCRVADYGFTKLIDLLEAVPNVVQVS
ncbi:unnamed protein product [Echinostoma caproni]|uniref:Meiosis regulator and mRNA stability factor 1 n=1 Tax=Echinostoma caproni TaxID=27848 RepID=A0A183B7N9_9TREM|nr:unnamed protein product [Echinostoma caproni]